MIWWFGAFLGAMLLILGVGMGMMVFQMQRILKVLSSTKNTLENKPKHETHWGAGKPGIK